jgi:hypothetical protein
MPLVDHRQLFGKLFPKYYNEQRTVNLESLDSRFWYAEITEVPGYTPYVSANITVSTTSNISDGIVFSEVKTSNPGDNQYRVEGQRVYFSVKYAGQAFFFKFYGIGNIVQSSDVGNDGGGDGTPGGSNGFIQFNNSGIFGGSSGLTWDVTQSLLSVNQIRITGGGAGLGKILTSDASGNATWQTLASSANPSGNDGDIQFKDGDALGSTSNLNWDILNDILVVGNTIRIEGGSPGAGKLLSSDASGNATWETLQITSGSDGDIQFKDGVDLGSNSSLNWDNINSRLIIGGSVRITSGSPGAGKLLSSDASGNATWETLQITSGSDGDIQFKDGADLGSNSSLNWDNINNRLVIGGSVRITSGSPGAGRLLSSDASGNATWTTLTLPSPGGINSEVQYNDGVNFAGASNLTYSVTRTMISGGFRLNINGVSSDYFLKSINAFGDAEWSQISHNNLTDVSGDGNLHLSSAQVTKLNGIESLAEVNIQSDWNEANSALDSFINNKPDINLQYVYDQSSNKFISTTSNGIAFRRGGLTDNDNVFMVQNGVGSNVLFVDGNGNLNISGNIIINGDATISGTTTQVNTTDLEITDNLIVLNQGESGAGISLGVSGVEIDRGTATNYQFVFIESDQSFKVGESGSLQTVATRENTPNDTSIVFWNNSTSILETNSLLTFSSNILSVPTIQSTTINSTTSNMGNITGTSLDISGTSLLTELRIDIASASTGRLLSSIDSFGNVEWIDPVVTSPGGSNTSIQYNNSGTFGGSSDLIWDSVNSTLATNGNLSVGDLTAPSLVNGSATTILEVAGSLNPGILFNSTGDNRIYLHYNSSSNSVQIYNDTTNTTLFRIDNFGRIGLGNVDPANYISGARNIVIEDSSAFCGLSFGSNASNGTQILFSKTTSRSSVSGAIQYFNSSDHLEFTSNGLESMRCNSSQEVVASTRIVTPALRITSSPTSGHVLTSDASGNATWQALSGGGYSPGSWVSVTAPTGWTGSILYRYDSVRGTVEFQSTAYQFNSGSETILMTLPVGQRPFIAQFIRALNTTNGLNLNRIKVNTDGTVVIQSSPEIGESLIITGVIYTTIA